MTSCLWWHGSNTLQPYLQARQEVAAHLSTSAAQLGDPLGGATRVLTNNVFDAGLGGTTAYFMGTQAAGGPLVVDYAAGNATGMIDWGAFTPAGNGGVGVAGVIAAGDGAYKMARTLSSQPNQVAVAGRRIMTAWLDSGSVALQALPRDLSLDPAGAGLLQQFSPELQALRLPSQRRTPRSPLPVPARACVR